MRRVCVRGNNIEESRLRRHKGRPYKPVINKPAKGPKRVLPSKGGWSAVWLVFGTPVLKSL